MIAAGQVSADSSRGIPTDTVRDQPFFLLGNFQRAANLAAKFNFCLAGTGHGLQDSKKEFAADSQISSKDSAPKKELCSNSGGEGGIRTPGTSFSSYNGLANRRIQPLCHLSGDRFELSTVFCVCRYFCSAISVESALPPTN